jgi:hypothetical protein
MQFWSLLILMLRVNVPWSVLQFFRFVFMCSTAERAIWVQLWDQLWCWVYLAFVCHGWHRTLCSQFGWCVRVLYSGLHQATRVHCPWSLWCSAPFSPEQYDWSSGNLLRSKRLVSVAALHFKCFRVAISKFNFFLSYLSVVPLPSYLEQFE